MFVFRQTQNEKTPPYSGFDFSATSEANSIKTSITNLVHSTDFKESDDNTKMKLLYNLLCSLSSEGSSDFSFPLIDNNTLNMTDSKIWGIYIYPNDFYSMWCIKEGRIIQYSYADYNSWNNRETVDTIYYIYY